MQNRVVVDRENLISEKKLIDLLDEMEKLIKPFKNNFSYEVIGSASTISKVRIVAEIFTR
jgi:hypothetical protein